MTGLLPGITVYVLLQLVVAFWASRRIRDEEDYLIAGRSLGLGLGTFTVFATWFGAETCIGAAGAIYEEGLSGGTADPFGYGACLLLMGAVFAVPLWRRKLVTFADLFQQRYSGGIERLAVLFMVPTSIIWAAAQVRAFGQVLSVSSGLGVDLAITAAGIVVVVYTVYGGMLADAVTDMLQGAVLILGLVLLTGFTVRNLGGVAPAIGGIDPERLRLLGGPDRSLWAILEDWAIPICGSVVAHELVARILACRSATTARRSALAGGSLYLGVGLMPVFLGLAAGPLLPALDHPEQILPALALETLSPFLFILFAGALISAILSTVDSALLSSAGLLSHNVILRWRPSTSERTKVLLARSGVVVLGTLAWVLALHAEGVYALVETASAFGSAGLFVVALFGLFSRFGGPRAATAAMLTGMAAWIAGAYVWDLAIPYLTSLGAALAAYLITALFERSRDAVDANSPEAAA